MNMHGRDTVVQCKKCGRKQFLDFINGLKNGWSECCGEKMVVIETTADVDKCIDEVMQEIRRAIPPTEIPCAFDSDFKCIKGRTCKRKCMFMSY